MIISDATIWSVTSLTDAARGVIYAYNVFRGAFVRGKPFQFGLIVIIVIMIISNGLNLALLFAGVINYDHN